MNKQVSNVCLMCGRKLKDPVSKERKYGKCCYAKLLKNKYKQLSLFGG